MAKTETKSVTITARITPTLNKKLVALAKLGKRTRSQAVEILLGDYVDRELALIEAVKIGLEELDLGRGIPHEDAMHQLRAFVAKKKRERRKAA